MSKYTVQLRYLVSQFESEASGPVPQGQDFHDSTYARLGLSAYPIFDEAYRPKLNDKIIYHFFFREIGQETAGLFSFMMKRTMNEVMPYYNEFYEQQAALINPLEERALHISEAHGDNLSSVGNSTSSTTQNANSSGSTTQASASETSEKQDELKENRNVFSDTPMGMLNNQGSPNVENLDYATNVSYDTGHADTSTTSTGKANADEHHEATATSSGQRNDGNRREEKREGGYTRDEVGHLKPKFELLYSYLKQFINIDMKVIEELEPLFLQLW